MTTDITKLFETLLSYGIVVAVAVASFFLAWGGFLYMTAAGSPHQMEKGKHAIINAVVGLGIVLLAHAIATAIQSALPAAPTPAP